MSKEGQAYERGLCAAAGGCGAGAFRAAGGDWLMEALAKKGWLLKIAERLGMEIKEEEK